jgi:hypothetical protein
MKTEYSYNFIMKIIPRKEKYYFEKKMNKTDELGDNNIYSE